MPLWAAMGIAAALASTATQPARTRIDFDAAGPPPLDAGCSRTLSGWETIRSIDDPRDGLLRVRGGPEATCGLIPGEPFRDGVVTARIDQKSGLAGFAMRYRDPEHYIDVSVHLPHGGALVRERRGEETITLGSARFDPLPAGTHEVTAALTGPHLSLFADGKRILDLAKATPVEGRAGLLAAPRAIAEFDDVEVVRWPAGEESLFVTPATLPEASVGVAFDQRFACHRIGTGAPSTEICSCTIAGGTLPPGLVLDSQCGLSGAAETAGIFDVEVLVRAESGLTARVPVRVKVAGTSWPRFPYDGHTRSTPAIALLYTSDDIGPRVTSLEEIGFPDRLLFRIHHDHPDLHVTLMACPAERSPEVAGRVEDSPAAEAVWKRIARDPALGWLELGGHGYTHSPDGDRNYLHHEFAVDQTGCNVDHARVGEREYCVRHMTSAREAYRHAGIPDDQVILMRFPGVVDNPEALRAAAGAGFAMIVGSRHLDEPGREWWIPYPDGGEILEIEGFSLMRKVYPPEGLEKGLEEGKVPASRLEEDPEFRASVARGLEFMEGVTTEGGILALADHIWETFAMSGGVPVRYLAVDAALRSLEAKYGSRIWYPAGRDLALWLDARRNASVSWREERDGVQVHVEPPPEWKARNWTGIPKASLLVHLPPRAETISEVEIRSGGGRPERLDPSLYWRAEGGLAITFPLRGPVDLLLKPVSGSRSSATPPREDRSRPSRRGSTLPPAIRASLP